MSAMSNRVYLFSGRSAEIESSRESTAPLRMPQELPPPTGEIILYSTEDGRARVECRFAGETVWLRQALMAELYQKDVRTINEHLQNLFEEGELDPEATIRKFRIVRQEGAGGHPAHRPLQPGGDPGCGLPGPLAPGCPVPALGHDSPERVPRERLPDGRRAAEEPARRRLRGARLL